MVGTGQKSPKVIKDQKSVEKVSDGIFLDACSIIFIDYFEKEKTFTRYYYAALLDSLNGKIKTKRPQMAKKRGPFNQENAPAHISLKVMAKSN